MLHVTLTALEDIMNETHFSRYPLLLMMHYDALLQDALQRYTPIKITGKKPINIILTFFHYYGCLILKF